jgi:cytochrome c oxidase subunit 3
MLPLPLIPWREECWLEATLQSIGVPSGNKFINQLYPRLQSSDRVEFSGTVFDLRAVTYRGDQRSVVTQTEEAAYASSLPPAATSVGTQTPPVSGFSVWPPNGFGKPGTQYTVGLPGDFVRNPQQQEIGSSSGRQALETLVSFPDSTPPQLYKMWATSHPQQFFIHEEGPLPVTFPTGKVTLFTQEPYYIFSAPNGRLLGELRPGADDPNSMAIGFYHEPNVLRCWSNATRVVEESWIPLGHVVVNDSIDAALLLVCPALAQVIAISVLLVNVFRLGVAAYTFRYVICLHLYEALVTFARFFAGLAVGALLFHLWILIKMPIFKAQKHPYHILGASPFPILTALFLFSWLVPQVFYLHGLPLGNLPRADLIHGSVIGLYLTVMSWFLTIVKESRWGYHTRKVQKGLRLGVILFILSEVMLFFAFFWAFFHYSLVPSIAIGGIWPPYGTQVLNVWGLPLVNTILLLASGVTITVAHAYIIQNNKDGFSWYLMLTILLGCMFLFCQWYEYTYGVKFSWSGNLYGSIFFVTTGFHGLHVTVGTMFLLFCWLRHHLTSTTPVFHSLLKLLGYRQELGIYWGFAPQHHFGFEAAAWYWHFVDVVWLFLFITVYWWGGA